MPKQAKCKDPNCRSNRPVVGSNYCINCKARKILKFNPKYSQRNYIFRGTYNDEDIYNLVEYNNPFHSYDISLSYCLTKIPREYLRILLNVPERKDIEYYLRNEFNHDTKAIRCGKHIIVWFKLRGINYLFTPGQIKLPI